MSSQLQNGGYLKDNDFSAKIHDGFWIFWERDPEDTPT